jgi:integrative and conjugative element protein (TIGR02256 family)
MSVVHLSRSLLRVCEREVTHAFPMESGGVLMGRRVGRHEWLVDQVVGPGPSAHHSRYRFSPDLDYQREQIAQRFIETQGQSTYLGDWHSHPQARHGRLSYLDRHVLGKIMDTPEAQRPTPLMMILWGTPAAWSPTIWRALGGLRGLFSPWTKVVQCRLLSGD